MKRFVVVAVVLVCLTALLISCGQTVLDWERTPVEGIDFDLYHIQVSSGTEDGAFKTETVEPTGYYSEEQVESAEVETIQLGKRNYKVTLQKIIRRGQDSEERVFEDESGTIECRLLSLKQSFRIRAKTGFLSAFDEQTVLSEETLKDHALRFLSDYIELSFIENYDYSCTTRDAVHTPNAAWGETRDEFFIPPTDNPSDETIEIVYYSMTYSLYCGSYRTNDYVTITFDPKGNIRELLVCFTGVDWNSVRLPNEDMLQKKAIGAIKASLNSNYRYEDSELVSQRITYAEDGKIFITCSYSVKISRDGNHDYSTLCAVRITFDKE